MVRRPNSAPRAGFAPAPAFCGKIGGMRELTRSNDLVWISWLTAYLADAGVESHVLDGHMSALEGSAIAIQRRVMVADEDLPAAERLMAEAARGVAGDDG
jgi:hypothetical protein